MSRADDRFAAHQEAWREPAQIASHWADADAVDPALLKHRARGGFWDALEKSRSTLLITREYEHLVLALTVNKGQPELSYLPLPHPSGLTVDEARGIVYVASTRNPNQLFHLQPARARGVPALHNSLVPTRTTFFPGRSYIHDLAMVGKELHLNLVGHNAIARIGCSGGLEPVWWPKCIDGEKTPAFNRNYLQLNSIAAGSTLKQSFFSASTDRRGRQRPGDLDFKVDGRGVIFSGKTREPMARGLTRPHTARLRGKALWVNNSGYGETGFIRDGRLEVVSRLPGWTRGLCMLGNTAFVATSRVIPRFSHYAPGLDVDKAVCGLHAIDLRNGKRLGSLGWPEGNQVFAVEAVPRSFSRGFPFSSTTRRAKDLLRDFFFAYETPPAPTGKPSGDSL